MIRKKIALLGASGKTSLVRRFVQSAFSETWLTTMGVKVDKKQVMVGRENVTLMVWDVAGTENHFATPTAYLRGAAGYLLVVDGAQPDSIERGLDTIEFVYSEIGQLPFVLVLNEVDQTEGRRTRDEALSGVRRRGCPILRASARTGAGVEEAFLRLAELVIAPSASRSG